MRASMGVVGHSARARVRARANARDERDGLYFALGVAPGASAEACKRAYKGMAKRYHPDVCDDEDEVEIFIRAKAAYETLSAASGNLETVQTYEWKLKWRAQIEKLRAERVERARVEREREEAERISLVGTVVMKHQIETQMAGLRDQTRRRRNVMKPKSQPFLEPFADDAERWNQWNHEVQ